MTIQKWMLISGLLDERITMDRWIWILIYFLLVVVEVELGDSPPHFLCHRTILRRANFTSISLSLFFQVSTKNTEEPVITECNNSIFKKSEKEFRTFSSDCSKQLRGKFIQSWTVAAFTIMEPILSPSQTILRIAENKTLINRTIYNPKYRQKSTGPC